MIFLVAENKPLMFIMLTEADCNDMRNGRTKFIDETATDGSLFNKVVISLHKNQQEIEEMLKKAGHCALLQNMSSPVPKPQEVKCAGCEATILESNLLDGRCIACWRELARVGQRGYRENTEI